MRRVLVLSVVLALMMIGLASPATSAPSPEGALNAGFNASFSGGNGSAYGEFFHGGAGGPNSAPNAIWFGEAAIRIVPGFFDQTYCDSDVFGIWWFLVDVDKDLVANSYVEIWLDGEQLDLKATPVKRYVSPQGVFTDGEKLWWSSTGVPVLGTLEIGDHAVSSHIMFPDGTELDEAVTVTINDC